LNCENCGAPMKVAPGRDYWYCEYCSSFYFPKQSSDGVRVLGQASTLQCPVCHASLVSASVGGEETLYCDKCRGLLLKQAAFAVVVRYLRNMATTPATPPPPLDPKEYRRRVDCPNCGRVMDTHPYYGPGNVVIDVCMGCALLWLDCGEFAQIVNAPGSDRPYSYL
jgi:Zn-finger nucleic acid-binding protein